MATVEESLASTANTAVEVEFRVHRVPFFLEPGYMNQPEDFTEPHDTRMVRKFGSQAAFDRVKASHGLIPRGNEVGLDASIGYTQEALSRRVQSSTLASHRLVRFVAVRHGWRVSEELYSVLSRKHFLEAGVLNSKALLLEACTEVAAVDTAACQAFLDSDEGTQDVLDVYQHVTDMGINSIPTVVVNGKYLVNGAARADEYVDLFTQILQSSSDGAEGGTLFSN